MKKLEDVPAWTLPGTFDDAARALIYTPPMRDGNSPSDGPGARGHGDADPPAGNGRRKSSKT
jgi:hypothetical protein